MIKLREYICTVSANHSESKSVIGSSISDEDYIIFSIQSTALGRSFQDAECSNTDAITKNLKKKTF